MSGVRHGKGQQLVSEVTNSEFELPPQHIIAFDSQKGQYFPTVLPNATLIEAAEDIPLHRAVARNTDNRGILGSDTDSSRFNYIGISLTAILTGQTGFVQTLGILEDATWSWSLAGHKYVYMTAGGVLVQASPTTVSELVQQVAVVLDTDKLQLDRLNRVIL